MCRHSHAALSAHYSDGTTAVIEAGQYTLSDIDMSTAGEKTVTVTYEDKTATFTIKVGQEEAAKKQQQQQGTGNGN